MSNHLSATTVAVLFTVRLPQFGNASSHQLTQVTVIYYRATVCTGMGDQSGVEHGCRSLHDIIRGLPPNKKKLNIFTWMQLGLSATTWANSTNLRNLSCKKNHH